MYLPYTFDPKHQVEIVVPFLDFLRREFPAHGPFLFVYEHKTAHTFVVAGWSNRDRRRCVDLCNLGGAPTLTPQHVTQLRFVLDPPLGQELTHERVRDVAAAADRDEMRQLQGESEELQNLKSWVWRNKLNQCQSPFFEDVHHRPQVTW